MLIEKQFIEVTIYFKKLKNLIEMRLSEQKLKHRQI